MTVNLSRTPNHMHICGDTTVGHYFGAVLSVSPVVYKGNGHHPHYAARFANGLKLELCPATATELARGLTEAIAALPLTDEPMPDVSGAVADLEEA